MASNAMPSPKATARVAGLLYFVSALTGGLGLTFVRNQVDFDNAAGTASNILAHESLFRAGIFLNISSQIFFVLLGLTLFHLFKNFNENLSRILLTLIAITSTLAIFNTLTNFGALFVLIRADFVKVFEQDKLHAYMLMFLRLNNSGQGILEVVWTPLYLTLGLLIIKSRYLPKVFGFLYVAASFTFLLNTFTFLIVPQYHFPIFTTMAMAGGGLSGIPTIFWLLIKGVKVPQAA